MNQFVCRLCGATEWSNQYELMTCCGCGVGFEDPDMFTLPPVKFIKLDPDAVTPTRAKNGDIGYDVCAIKDIELYMMAPTMVQTGLSVELPPNTEIQVRPRSGLAYKNGIIVVNSPGTIDTEYRGPCNIIMMNTKTSVYSIKKGDKIAQFVVAPKLPYRFVEVDKLTDTERGENGFGSSGK